jgi:hypothetical protein
VSYHIGPSPLPHAALAPAVQAHQYPLLPLAQVPSTALAPLGLSENAKRVLIIIAIFLVAAIFFSMLTKKQPTPNRRPAKRLSTPEMAKMLYERLERRGGAHETTLRSLQSYANRR